MEDELIFTEDDNKKLNEKEKLLRELDLDIEDKKGKVKGLNNISECFTKIHSNLGECIEYLENSIGGIEFDDFNLEFDENIKNTNSIINELGESYSKEIISLTSRKEELCNE